MTTTQLAQACTHPRELVVTGDAGNRQCVECGVALPTAPTHGGTALVGGANGGSGRGGRLKTAEIVCDCGERFPATRTLIGVEPDHYESPEWESHVKAHRT